MTFLAVGMARLGSVLFDPVSSLRGAVRDPALWPTAIALAAGLALLGSLTLPRQLADLALALAPVGSPLQDGAHAMMRPGLLRLMLADRLLPPATPVLAAALLALGAEPVLALSGATRRAPASVAALGLAPILIERLGEVALTYLAPHTPQPVLGAALGLPHRLVSGPLLFFSPGAAPAWAETLEPRLNLFTLWCLVLWILGLRALDGERLRGWHVGLAIAALAGGAVLSWALTSPAVALVLGSP
jgi:hypothetical protein